MKYQLVVVTLWIHEIYTVLSNPFLRPITSRSGKIETNEVDFLMTSYTWNFKIPENNEMIYIALWDSYKGSELKLAGRKVSKLHQNFGGYCYYFATRHTDSKDMRKLCKEKAETDSSNCHYLEVDTFYMTYEGSEPPNFKLSYMYTECADQPLTPTTTTPIPHSITSTTMDSDNEVDERINSDFGDNNKQKQNDTDAVTMATGKTDQRDDDDNAKLIIIPVILASVFFALTVLLLLFCGIRINQQRVEQESIKLQQLQKKSGSGTDSRKCNNNIITNIHSQQIDETYAEIGPMLPLRNPNMKPQEEQRYETPMRMQYGRNQDIIHSEAYLQSTTPNKVFKNAEENCRQNAAEDDISRQNGSEIPGENLAGPYTVMNGSTYELNTVNNVLYNM